MFSLKPIKLINHEYLSVITSYYDEFFILFNKQNLSSAKNKFVRGNEKNETKSAVRFQKDLSIISCLLVDSYKIEHGVRTTNKQTYNLGAIST